VNNGSEKGTEKTLRLGKLIRVICKKGEIGEDIHNYNFKCLLVYCAKCFGF